jgi:hypothetical protein
VRLSRVDSVDLGSERCSDISPPAAEHKSPSPRRSHRTLPHTCAARRTVLSLPDGSAGRASKPSQVSNSASRPTGRFRPHGAVTVTVTVTVHDLTRRIAWLCLVTAAVPAGKANSLAPFNFLQLGGLGHSRRLPQPGVPRQAQPIIEYASLKSTVAVPPQRMWACATSVALRSVQCVKVHTTVHCSLVCR